MNVNFNDTVIATEFSVVLNHNFITLPKGYTEIKSTLVIGCTDSQTLGLE